MRNFTRYYFDDIVIFWHRVIEFSDVLLDEKFIDDVYEP